jgi:lysozyme
MITLEQGDSMTEALMNRIKAQLVRHEGLRLKPYRCTSGKLTIGIGRNLDDRGISQKEAYAMLERDIQDCEQWLIDEIPEIYNKLDEVRQSVLLNMCFNLGIKGLLGFKNTLDFIGAKWAKQVGMRAIELSEMMRKGK